MTERTRRLIECTLLFVVMPSLLYFIRHQLAFRVFFLLLGCTAICTFMLLRDKAFDRRHFWRSIDRQHLSSMALFFIPLACTLTLLTAVLLPERLLSFPQSRPVMWLVVMLLYPVLMVIPQEICFRVFFFHRYRDVFGGREIPLILINALSFGVSHLFYGNWVAPALSFFGGLLFAWRYQTSRSLPMVCIEHALWGNFLFTVGIGWYFYSGAIV